MSTSQRRGSAKDAVQTQSLRLFASRGVDAVSLRDIAAVTGFSNPVLFRHFASKEALAEALFERCYRRLADGLVLAADTDGLQAWLQAALTEVARLPEGVLFVLDNLKRYWHTLPDDLKARNLPRLALTMIEREYRAGRVRADIPPSLVVTVLFGTLGQIARSVHFHESTIHPETLAESLSLLLCQGLQPRCP
jgi:AcrR family transcriptional regulator